MSGSKMGKMGLGFRGSGGIISGSKTGINWGGGMAYRGYKYT